LSIKGSTLLLVGSLTANAAMLAVIAITAPSVFRIGSSDRDPGLGKSAPPQANPANGGARVPGVPDMAALFAGDPKVFAARLRGAGLPPSVVRAMILAQLNEMVMARRREILSQAKVNPFWSQGFRTLDPASLEKFSALYKERNDLQKQLLPDDPPPVNPRQQIFYGGLSAEKTRQVQAISQDYSELKNGIYNSANGTLLKEDADKLALLDKEQQADMESALSPSELLEYQIRQSPTADSMRNSMQVFSPTEDEFRAIFKVQQAFDQQYGANNDQLTSDQRAERQKYQGEVLDQLQSVLSPDRLAEYKEETDPKFLAVNQVLSRFDLPATATKQVMDIQGDITKRADAIRQDKSISDAERASQLSALADEATTRATSVVGDRGFEAYRQTAGSWIQGLEPPAN
jgi:hypothetical protein